MSVEPLLPVKTHNVDNLIAQGRGPIAQKLLAWYDANARDLPWRAPPGANRTNPYHVWLSEIMLQQTTVAAVKPYFAKFTSRWPDIAALAEAQEADILAAWAGLGYYARARNLVKCARVIAADHHGNFPQNEQALRALPGIGDYTAAAIAAIAFGERAVVVDANVERVVARLFMIDTPLPKARKFIREKTDSITPQSRSGDFAQAMMDLGSSLCRAKDAQCKACPLFDECLAGQNDKALNFPVKKPKTAKPIRQGKAYWIEKNGAIWLVKRPDKGMLGGMRALPDNGWRAASDGDMPPPIIGPWSIAGEPVVHHFTHFTVHLQLHIYAGPTDSINLTDNMENSQNGEWWPLDRLEDAGLPTLFAKAAFIGSREYKRLI